MNTPDIKSINQEFLTGPSEKSGDPRRNDKALSFNPQMQKH